MMSPAELSSSVSNSRESEYLSLSFCDLPNSDKFLDCKNLRDDDDDRGSNCDFEFLEAFKDLQVKMCAADDIFFQGKLLPKRLSPSSNPRVSDQASWTALKAASQSQLFHRRSESVECGRAASSRSCFAEYRRLDKERMARKGSGSRPKWYLMMFGTVRPPAAMDIGEIRSRQRPPGGAVAQAEGVGEGRSKWRLLRALSCRGEADAVVL